MPQYAGPIAVLRPDDVLTFACPVCGHQASMEARRLTERVSSDVLVEDIDHVCAAPAAVRAARRSSSPSTRRPTSKRPVLLSLRSRTLSRLRLRRLHQLREHGPGIEIDVPGCCCRWLRRRCLGIASALRSGLLG